jgi:hypothetical protein
MRTDLNLPDLSGLDTVGYPCEISPETLGRGSRPTDQLGPSSFDPAPSRVQRHEARFESGGQRLESPAAGARSALRALLYPQAGE